MEPDHVPLLPSEEEGIPDGGGVQVNKEDTPDACREEATKEGDLPREGVVADGHEGEQTPVSCEGFVPSEGGGQGESADRGGVPGCQDGEALPVQLDEADTQHKHNAEEPTPCQDRAAAQDLPEDTQQHDVEQQPPCQEPAQHSLPDERPEGPETNDLPDTQQEDTPDAGREEATKEGDLPYEGAVADGHEGEQTPVSCEGSVPSEGRVQGESDRGGVPEYPDGEALPVQLDESDTQHQHDAEEPTPCQDGAAAQDLPEDTQQHDVEQQPPCQEPAQHGLPDERPEGPETNLPDTQHDVAQHPQPPPHTTEVCTARWRCVWAQRSVVLLESLTLRRALGVAYRRWCRHCEQRRQRGNGCTALQHRCEQTLRRKYFGTLLLSLRLKRSFDRLSSTRMRTILRSLAILRAHTSSTLTTTYCIKWQVFTAQHRQRRSYLRCVSALEHSENKRVLHRYFLKLLGHRLLSRQLRTSHAMENARRVAQLRKAHFELLCLRYFDTLRRHLLRRHLAASRVQGLYHGHVVRIKKISGVLMSVGRCGAPLQGRHLVRATAAKVVGQHIYACILRRRMRAIVHRVLAKVVKLQALFRQHRCERQLSSRRAETETFPGPQLCVMAHTKEACGIYNAVDKVASSRPVWMGPNAHYLLCTDSRWAIRNLQGTPQDVALSKETALGIWPDKVTTWCTDTTLCTSVAVRVVTYQEFLVRKLQAVGRGGILRNEFEANTRTIRAARGMSADLCTGLQLRYFVCLRNHAANAKETRRVRVRMQRRQYVTPMRLKNEMALLRRFRWYFIKSAQQIRTKRRKAKAAQLLHHSRVRVLRRYFAVYKRVVLEARCRLLKARNALIQRRTFFHSLLRYHNRCKERRRALAELYEAARCALCRTYLLRLHLWCAASALLASEGHAREDISHLESTGHAELCYLASELRATWRRHREGLQVSAVKQILRRNFLALLQQYYRRLHAYSSLRMLTRQRRQDEKLRRRRRRQQRALQPRITALWQQSATLRASIEAEEQEGRRGCEEELVLVDLQGSSEDVWRPRPVSAGAVRREVRTLLRSSQGSGVGGVGVGVPAARPHSADIWCRGSSRKRKHKVPVEFLPYNAAHAVKGMR